MTKSKSKRSSKKRETGTTPIANSSSKSITRKRREERQRQKQRNQRMFIAGAVVVTIVVAAIAFFVATQPASAPIPDGTLERYAGIPQDFTEAGYARLGNPAAPIRIEEYSSFSCPGCQAFWESSIDGIVQLVREGKISFTFIPMLTGELTNPRGAQSAALCAGEQGMFFEYHDMLFDWHTRYVNRAFSGNRLNSGADSLELDSGAFSSCLGSNNDVIDGGVNEAGARGVTGTPATFLNGSPITSDINVIRTRVDEEIQRLGVVPIPLTTEDEDGVQPEATADIPPETTSEPEEEPAETTPEPDDSVETTEEAPADNGDS